LDVGCLVLEEDQRRRRVWLYWCDEQGQARGPRVVQALEVGARLGVQFCKQAVSDPFPPPSQLGDSPHLRTGGGRDSIRHGVESQHSRTWVGTQMIDRFNHMAWHDQHGRPWLLETLERHHAQIEQAVAAHLG
jgi:hypothetical protein